MSRRGNGNAGRMAKWAAALIVGHLIYLRLVRPWHTTWGATADEASRPLPGDEQVRDPVFVTTRAVSIAAPAELVWGFLAQMGYQRGGLYSYDGLDQLFGILDRPSADTILPEFQGLAAGDVIPLGSGPDWPVTVAEPGRTLVLAPMEDQVSWSFSLTPLEGGTRLLSRVRVQMGWPPLMHVLASAIEVPWLLMERKMLLGIKQRAEAEARRS